jgi:hypothetical protein
MRMGQISVLWRLGKSAGASSSALVPARAGAVETNGAFLSAGPIRSEYAVLKIVDEVMTSPGQRQTGARRLLRAHSGWRSGLLLALAMALLAAPTLATPEEHILLLTGDTASLDDQALLEAVTIYTRDLGLSVIARPGAPAVADAQGREQVAALLAASNARLAFWYELRGGPEGREVILYTLASKPDDSSLHALRVRSPDEPGLYRALALKLRAVLTGAAASEPEEPLPAAPPRAASPASPPQVDSVPPRPEVAAAPSLAARPATSPPRAFVAVAYRLQLPLNPALVRHALLAEGAVPLGRRLRLHVTTELATQPTLTAPAGLATLFDWPLRVGLRVMGRRGRWSGGVGPVASLHVLLVRGVTNDGARGSARTAIAGLGAELVGMAHISAHVAAELRLLVEALVPGERFLLRGQTVLETRGVVFALGVGVVFAAP